MNTHLIYIPMTGVGLYGGYRGDAWYKERAQVFLDYTLNSLAHQTNMNFVVWMSFRPEEEHNPITAMIAREMKDRNVRFVFTFNGLMYNDDKFTDGLVHKTKNILRCMRDWKRNNRTLKEVMRAIREIYVNKNKTLVSRMKKSLAVLEPYFGNSSMITMTRIDSDDLFHHMAVEIIQNFEPAPGALVCGKGLIYNTETKELAEWNPPTNPPFHTIMMSARFFFKSEIHYDIMREYKSHEDVTKMFQCRKLPDYFYCVTTHNPKNHISTIWNHPFKGWMVESEAITDYI